MTAPTPLHLTLHNAEPISQDVVAMLAGAAGTATATEALALLPLIAKAREVHIQLCALLAAVREDAA